MFNLLRLPPCTGTSVVHAPLLRSQTSRALALFNARDHTDSALQLVAVMLTELPQQWTADPKFALLVLRLAGVEMKVILDDVDTAIANHGASSSSETGSGEPAPVKSTPSGGDAGSSSGGVTGDIYRGESTLNTNL